MAMEQKNTHTTIIQIITPDGVFWIATATHGIRRITERHVGEYAPSLLPRPEKKFLSQMETG